VALEDKFNALPEGIESEDVAELRRALMRVQKQLLQAKQRTDELVEVTHQAAYDATLGMGPITPVKVPDWLRVRKNLR